MRKKALPFDKTLVARFVIELADTYNKRVLNQGSFACKVLNTYNFISCDQNVVAGTTFQIGPIHTFVCLNSYQQFRIAITVGGQTITTTSNGQFIFNGALDSITVSPIDSISDIRIACIWA